ncbi:MAG TPA: PhnD/SsuA/transferrin family substrate-binding protein [Actinomycetota bacterium]|nr:PhnD/SsuA/transferrin family substrate-binding protein [Actinomycetota bacterium]
MKLVANARMYAIDASVGARWRELFAWIAKRAEIPLEPIEHRAPAPLEALWRRTDLGAAAMCGYPLATWSDDSRPVPIAAPAPSPEPFAGRAVYWTDIVVRTDSPFERDDDLAGSRFGWTAEDSQSGYQAPRRHFAARALARGGRFFASTVGPLVTPRRVVEAIVEGSIDAGPLDAYWHTLLRLHEPETAFALRVIARTEDTPIPCFVAATATPEPVRERLTQAFVDSADEAALSEVLADLALARFVRTDIGAYESLSKQAREIDALGYARLA